MSFSPLSFVSSQEFRKTLLGRNLKPYKVTGFFSPISNDRGRETILRDIGVTDSPDDFVSTNRFANNLYPLNNYGPEGGYNDVVFNNKLGDKPNQGEYSPNDTVLDLVNEFYIDAAYIENIYGPIGGFNSMVVIDNIQNNNKLYLPYYNLAPISFVPSTYSAYNIFLSKDALGSNGLVSQDSYLAKIGSDELRKLLVYRVNVETSLNSYGTVNLASLQDPFQSSLYISGQQPLVYQNFRITNSDEPNSNTSLQNRLAGQYYPSSPIPGDYFTPNEINGGQSAQVVNALNTINRITGGFLGPIIATTNNSSQIFLQNTGNGQRSVLFANLDYNRYKPNYERNYGGALNGNQANVTLPINVVDTNTDTLVGGYYVGNRNAEPSLISSPPGQVPVNAFGKQEVVPVYGPQDLGILYEGNENRLNFGLAGKSFSDGGGLDGDFVWTSPKYKGNAGFRPTKGGGTGRLDEEFNQISSKYQRDQSTNINFRPSSILDKTQRLIDSADNVSGILKLKHVGNAINQVSKVFNDGYKELTKGSKVLAYTDNTTGTEIGVEYCRVFAKDTPYYTYNDLQKKDGITTSGRRFTNSILDNTFNLNISPTKNPGSTNIKPNNRNQLIAKKYMFSLENLAWRTSGRPGFTYDDLPACERGPNGGRVMWFPPYDLTFSDSSTANFTPTSFLGRPEPIYTYRDSSRNGSISWKIIVDHPSVMDLIVDKQLQNQTNSKIDSIMNSFFAGCVKYDIYELAKKFNTIPISDLITYQEAINNPRLTVEELQTITKEIPKDNFVSTPNNPDPSVDENQKPQNINTDFSEFYGLSFYYDNNSPTTAEDSFVTLYQTYTSSDVQNQYKNNANSLFNPETAACKLGGNDLTNCNIGINVETFYSESVISNYTTLSEKFISNLYDVFEQKPKTTIKITLQGSASSLDTEGFNKQLSQKRIDNIKNFIKTFQFGGNKSLATPPGGGTLEFIEQALGETTTVTPKGSSVVGSPINCNTRIKGGTNNTTDEKNANIYSVQAMACRRVNLANVEIIASSSDVENRPTTNTTSNGPIQGPTKDEVNNSSELKKFQQIRQTSTPDLRTQIKNGIGKKILRSLLSECDYFEVIKEQSPFLYDSIKQRIKFFNPAFHSITPEGLNSRLTFLNQCVRPGETIPVIGVDGRPKQNDALNTSFGTPPILILRIGDFYHTKIVPDGVSFAYENNLLDLNPEGIGVQPMIVKVTMNFKIIGGMGLGKPIEQLQNALSFNFYANTEVYDERATPTEDTTAIDKNILDALIAQQPQSNVKNTATQPTNNGGTTIGEIVTNLPVENGQTGETTYQKVMTTILNQTTDYYEALLNKLESVNDQYNMCVVQILNSERQYSKGYLSLDETESNKKDMIIYGKPVYESIINQQFDDAINDVNSGNNPLLNQLTKFFKPVNNEESSVMIRLKQNMTNYLTNLKTDFSNGLALIIQDLVSTQQTYVQTIRQVNTITKKIDGKLLEVGVPRIYNITETSEVSNTTYQNTYQELIGDYSTISSATTVFNDYLKEKNIAFFTPPTPSSQTLPYTLQNEDDFENLSDKRFYFIMSKIITDKNKKEDFINQIIKGELINVKPPKNSVNLSIKFREFVKQLEIKYEKEIRAEKKLMNDVQKSETIKKLTKGKPKTFYDSKKVRKFTYTTVPNAQEQTSKTTILNLYSQQNINDDKDTFIGKVKFN